MRKWYVQIMKDTGKDILKAKSLQGKRKDCVVYVKIGKELLEITKRNVKGSRKKLHMKIVKNVTEYFQSQMWKNMKKVVEENIKLGEKKGWQTCCNNLVDAKTKLEMKLKRQMMMKLKL